MPALPVTVLPGPSAVETALVASGLAGERFQFLGYLPRGGRRAAIGLGGAVGVAASRRRVRVAAAAAGDAAVARRAMPDRPVAVCRELTKRFEEVVRGPALEVAARFAEPPKGEVTVVFGSAEPVDGVEEGEASRPWASSSLPACPGARPPTSSPASRAFPVTLSMRNR